MGKFDGKVAVITGGGKGGGIGYGLSTAFAKEGCDLVITGRNTRKLDDAREELERLYGVKVLACQADGGVEEQVAGVVKQAADTFGRIDFLINNAQNSASGVPLAEHTKEDFDKAVYSGLYAVFFYMKHAYPYLKQARGSVVNFASGAGLFGNYGQCAYAAAKEGIRGLTRVAAEEKALTSEINLPLLGTGESILDIGGSFTLTSLTMQTGQASCQGILQVQVCCQPPESEALDVRTKEMTVQQTIDLPGAAESDQCIAWGELLHCTLRTEDGAADASLSVTWKLHLELWRLAAHTVVADAYSTLCQAQTVQTVCKLLQRTTDLNGHLSVTVEDDLPTPDAEVRGCFVTLEAPVQIPEEAASKEKAGETRWELQGKGTAHVLCADSRGELTCYDKAFTWQPEGSWQGSPGDAYPCLHADVTRLTSGKSGTRLRVEIELSITGSMLQAQAQQALSEVDLGEEFTDGTDGPVLYLYYAQEGERIFDIAKRYHARAKDLAAANHLETGGTAPQDLTTESTCLLIPAAL